MKTSSVAISVTAILGVVAIWSGASWYTGKSIEKNMPKFIDKINHKISDYLPAKEIKLTYEDYDRGIFSTKVRYLLQINDSKTGKDKKATTLVFSETIHHGPFPIAQIKKGVFLPSMAFVHSTLENTPDVQKIFAASHDSSPVNVDSRIAFNGDSASVISFSPLEYQHYDTRFTFSGGTITADLSKDMNDARVTAQSDAFSIIHKNKSKQVETLSFKGITVSSISNMGKFNVAVGEQDIAFKKIELNVNDKKNIALEGMALHHKMNELEQILNTQSDYSLDDLKINGQDFGSGKLSIALDHIDGQTIRHFIEIYKNKGMNTEAKNSDTSLNTDQNDIIKNIWQALTKGKAVLKIQPASWKNSQGESTFNFNAQMTSPEPAPMDAQDISLIKGMKKIDARLNIPVVMLKEFLTQVYSVLGNGQEASQKSAEQQVQNLITLGEMLKLTTVENGHIRSQFHFENDQIDLNGQTFSLQKFSELFSLDNLLHSEQQTTPETPLTVTPSNP